MHWSEGLQSLFERMLILFYPFYSVSEAWCSFTILASITMSSVKLCHTTCFWRPIWSENVEVWDLILSPVAHPHWFGDVLIFLFVAISWLWSYNGAFKIFEEGYLFIDDQQTSYLLWCKLTDFITTLVFNVFSCIYR